MSALAAPVDVWLRDGSPPLATLRQLGGSPGCRSPRPSTRPTRWPPLFRFSGGADLTRRPSWLLPAGKVSP